MKKFANNFKPYVQSFDYEQSRLRNATVLYKCTKAKAHKIREYLQDPQDPWFIYIVEYTKTSKDWTRMTIVTEKDVQYWVDSDIALGWDVKTIIP
jgi:hypothetical protein